MDKLSDQPRDREMSSTCHGYQNPHEGKTPQPSARFLVEQVKNEPKDTMELSDTDSGAHSRVCSDTSRPISIIDGTIGYATNEAVPMTVFYRNEYSQSHAKKYRPTLQELQKGFEEVPDQQVNRKTVIVKEIKRKKYSTINNFKQLVRQNSQIFFLKY